MSNPAVISLAETETNIGDYRIEDNIGESIHIHLGDFREDLTVKEFYRFTEGIEAAVESFVGKENFRLSDYSLEFISRIADTLPDLIRIQVEEVKLGDLIVDARGLFGIQTKKKLKHSRVIKALKGDTDENDNRDERNYFNQTSQERLNIILESIKNNGYPYKNKLIVLFNNSNEIMDGQHRAAVLYHLHGNIKVPVRRLFFRNNKYTDSVNPYFARIYRWDKKRIYRLLRLIYHQLKKIRYITIGKYLSLMVRIDRYKYGKEI